jgi:multidrug efflux pump subunit AcrA (membrane-fusion protein)
VSTGDIAEIVEARGRIAAKQESLLVFPLTGKLKAVHVAPGDQVAAGVPLAEMDAPDLARQVLDQGYSLATAQLDLAKAEVTARSQETLAEAELVLAEAQHRRDLEAGSASEARARLQIARTSAYILTATHKLEVQITQARLDWARARYLQVSQQLSNTLLIAPFAGQIVSVEKRPGDQVEAYESIGVIADPSELWVVATVLAEDIDRVAVGQPVTARLDAFPSEAYTGSVLQIASQTSVWQGRNAYDVTVAFDAGQQVPAIIRMGADVIIAGPLHENVLVVPARAIITIGGQAYVEVVGEGGQVERVAVRIGISDGTQTEIVAGLQAGQVIRIP